MPEGSTEGVTNDESNDDREHETGGEPETANDSGLPDDHGDAFGDELDESDLPDDYADVDGKGEADESASRNEGTSLEDMDYADPEDFGLTRDGKANRVPVDKLVEGVGKCRFIPLNYGDAQNYFGDAGDVTSADAGTIATVLNKHMKRPNLGSRTRGGELDAAMVKNMSPMVPANCLMALFEASGVNADVEVDDQGNADIEFGDEGN